jgi:DNA-binding NtrC family response regulator
MKHSKGNILIVEDDDGVAELQAMRLQRCGHIVTRARGAEETFTLLEQQQFDLVVLDYGLEGDINGVRLFMILRERGLTIPAILVTGFEDPKIIVEAMRAGCARLFTKNSGVFSGFAIVCRARNAPSRA